jgi:alkylation response protein AidB-like acyl-CoA dehydrogenase
VSLDLAWDHGQQAIADALLHFCRDRCGDDVTRNPGDAFPSLLWGELAELGVLATGSPEGEGGPREIAAAMESLGHAVFPGPLVASFFALRVLPEKERCAVADGRAIVSLGTPPLMPWAPHADLFIELQAERAWLAHAPRDAVASVRTLGGELWGRVELARGRELEGVARARQVAQMAAAAYLASAGQRLVADAAEHARTRKQFDRAIGEFQAVAHPLADTHMRLSAASTLARAAACELADGGDRVGVLCAAASLSAAAAALESVNVCHQIFGAVGITLEGPVFHVSRRIRQVASSSPLGGPARGAVLADFGLTNAAPGHLRDRADGSARAGS